MNLVRQIKLLFKYNRKEGVIKNKCERAEGNFSIQDRYIKIECASFEAGNLNIHFGGKIYFSGEVDIIAGTKIIGRSLIKTAGQVILPYTLGFDIIKDVIEINITGRWPNLQQNTRIEPMAWFYEVFNFAASGDEHRYTLRKLWEQSPTLIKDRR